MFRKISERNESGGNQSSKLITRRRNYNEKNITFLGLIASHLGHSYEQQQIMNKGRKEKSTLRLDLLFRKTKHIKQT